MVVDRFPDRCGPSADQGIGSSGCRPHCLGWRRPTQAAAWSSGGAGDDRTDLANNGPCRDGEPSPLRIAARPRPDLTGQPRMAGLGMQAGSPLSHQLFGRVRMQHRGLLRDDKLHRPYLDGSARLGQCRPSPLAGAPQHLGLRIRLTSCMPCTFSSWQRSRSGKGSQQTGLLRVTVIVRWIPLVTAACGTRVARRRERRSFARGGDGSRLVRWVRPSSVTTASWARARRARQPSQEP
jgi:hypothetical protein